jgi:nitroreductase
MDATEAIRTRRSIRAYTDQDVSDELVRHLLEAAMMAPSAGNEQPWHFVVIRDRATLDEIPSFHPHSGMLKHAPLAVLICGDETLEKYKGYWVQDCSAATQNLLLEAHARGLGAVWLGIHPIDERVAGMRKLLGMPDHVIPFALISIGWPAEEKGRQDRFDETRVHQDRW